MDNLFSASTAAVRMQSNMVGLEPNTASETGGGQFDFSSARPAAAVRVLRSLTTLFPVIRLTSVSPGVV